ncbi:MAG TPA: hypothetical protein PLS94_06440 [Prolixibacteraceae bacterium]|nr:hypothetical protein [Prolixibacteraceae bacterium]
MRKAKITLILPILAILFSIAFNACSSKEDCTPFSVSAIDQFAAVEKEGFVPFYIHRGIDALAVNSEMYENQFAIAAYTFEKKKGEYEIKITTLLEVDGESTYQLMINGTQVAQIINDKTEVDFTEKIYSFGKFNLNQGDVIGIAFNNISNEEIVEYNGEYAFARGRWKNLIFERVCK